MLGHSYLYGVTMSSRRVLEIRYAINMRPLTDEEGQELLDEVDELNLLIDGLKTKNDELLWKCIRLSTDFTELKTKIETLTQERDEARGSLVDAREAVDQAIIEHARLEARLLTADNEWRARGNEMAKAGIELARLAAVVAKLREALKPFAVFQWGGYEVDDEKEKVQLTVGDLKRATRVLAETAP